MATSVQRMVDLLSSVGKDEFTRTEIVDIAKNNNINADSFLNLPTYRVRRGVYSVKSNTTRAMLSQPKLKVDVDDLVPLKDNTFVPFGFFKDLTTIIKSNAFYPVFITGMSGNGKTTMVEQACAKLNREVIRVNISIETDEDDLIGGNTLINGNVVYREGPVLIAMKRGAILILDECDRGSNKLMCLQAILEGKPYFNKKTGETVIPQKGFNIIATANTKGQGSDDGKYMSAQILDDAFLERFAITVEQEYPAPTIEKKIVINKMTRVDKVDDDFANKLVSWATIIRKTFKEGGVDEIISTRRLEHIVNAFAMFNNRMKAIELCVARFDAETKASFLDLYTKIDADVSLNNKNIVEVVSDFQEIDIEDVNVENNVALEA